MHTSDGSHRAVCPLDCPDACAMLVQIDGGRAVALRGDPQHPFTAGFLCHKVARYLERQYHPGRLTTPWKRIGPKGAGQFAPISWEQAFDEIADRFSQIASGPLGPQAILPYSYCGTMGRIQGESLDRRFFHRLGASLLERTICATAGALGYRYTIGSGEGTDPEAIDDSRYIINWGSNTADTNVHLWVRMHEARKRGATIVTIDPYRSRTAERSDWHLAPRVGTDAALALGVMHVLFRDGLHDEDYLQRFCIGAEQLRERVLRDHTPERTSAITGLDSADIERFAIEYATHTPSVIRANYGLQRHRGGGMAMRTIACLPAIIGAWRHRAGGMLLSTSATFPLNWTGLQRPALSPGGTRSVNMNQLAEALHGELAGPPVQALYVYNSNPVAVAPQQGKVIDGLLRDDLFTVVHEQFHTDTVDYADIVLPATTQFEHFDLHTSYGHQYLQANLPCLPPFEQSRSNNDVFRGLARRLNFESELFELSDEDLAREALWEFQSEEERPAALHGITVDRLRERGWMRLNTPDNHAPYREGKFATPSGKCELYSERMAAAGLDPLPTYIPPAESPESAPELAARFPLQLLSPPSPHFLNSTFVNVDSLRQSARPPELFVHRDDAQPRGIQTGDWVRVENDRGSFQAVATVGDAARAGVVVAPGIWWNRYTPDGKNANATTSTRLTDIGGGATFFDNLVEIRKLPNEPAMPSPAG